MEFENRFSVRAPIADVWDVLLDVERVAPCLPGAKVLERIGEDEYVVAMRVKVGPISMEYKGECSDPREGRGRAPRGSQW